MSILVINITNPHSIPYCHYVSMTRTFIDKKNDEIQMKQSKINHYEISLSTGLYNRINKTPILPWSNRLQHDNNHYDETIIQIDKNLIMVVSKLQGSSCIYNDIIISS